MDVRATRRIPRLAPPYELIANTCMRRGEACGLRPGDADADATRLVTPTDMARLVAELSTWVREAYQTGLGNEGIHILLGAVLTHKEAQK